jgi:ATP-dependent DNA helicase RecG
MRQSASSVAAAGSIRSVLAIDTPVQFIKGIGPSIAEALAAKGYRTAEDLLYHLPFRYEDRANPRALHELTAGELASVIGEVRGSALLRTRSMPIFEMTLGHGTATLKCIWFRGTYLKDRFHAGQTVAVYGRVEPSRSSRGFKMIQPQFEILPDAAEEGRENRLMSLEMGRITPIYESLGGARLGPRWMRRLLFQLLNELRGRIPETLPATLLQRLKLPSRDTSLQLAHFPDPATSLVRLQEARTAAHRRLIFEELFYLELGLELKRRKAKERAGIAFAPNEQVRAALREVLPFHPTAAQKRALGEIVEDMKQPSPMRRLLQGDVGSGKTIVALQAMLIAIENGYQAALMAPTEILATQHYLSARKLLERATRPYRITLLTGSLDPTHKRAARGRIARGEADLIIGTHALIEEKVEFDRLGLVVVDEQHRFGVLQRFRLMKKPGQDEPDVLVMTATPIPRTLALSLYGDLDLSVLDELPPGRTPIVTRRGSDEKAEEVWQFVRKQVAAGRQAYVVYPVIEGPSDDQPELDFPKPEEPTDDAPAKTAKRGKKAAATTASLFEKPTLKAATQMYEALRDGALRGLRLGLLHGRLSADDKEIVMRRFQRGELDVLISTTVIEVGVDVPNATVMVIEHAERFGLAQLHQLRGRVGRGNARSYCILMTGSRVSAEAEERLDAMVRTQDGFELAELDLKLRGPGEFFGTRQAGLPDFRVANLVRDRELLELAKQEAAAFVATAGAEATEAERATVVRRLKQAWQRRYGLVEAG